MVKINRPLVSILAVFLLLFSLWIGWFSLSEYLAFFKLSDVIIFSWKLGLMIFGTPLLLYFSYLAFYCVIKNKIPVMNNKLANELTILAFFGAAFSLIVSLYLSSNLNSHGYTVCQKGSWMEPNKYVKDIMLCSQ
ncbi:uncharacterized protein DUF1240 [Serratia fonticola]|uniref:Uncharacterized protein DUF1240 n=1 Tax=Serratia fonticola TaxID=47917 RepID=A0A542D5A3_SERFO|nr:DUF1240 domain-containing protein [Serratia fonticola]TQI79760.1 uncharacterized protein DUF1240 [Serratia fonticola]TQI98215.1 uncharacterized protein DUF1240 [Serratia fonticola]TVZ67743.1 uncharacterized protein DUF1240 [Serratia fonticola]